MNLDTALRIMRDPEEPMEQRLLAEAVLREHATFGMLPSGTRRAELIQECMQFVKASGHLAGPEPVRFSEEELHYVIAALSSVDSDSVTLHNVLAKLKHKEKTMRNTRSRIRKAKV